ncbi:MAG: TetR/AcrR family transcriptional regulator [Nitrospirae bacterium]|nr:TetR/AcrR family transcriptional regulator [Nitrospirota bacterium]
MNYRSDKEGSKDRILKVALDLFSTKGYAGTKMIEIASRVGMSVGALYLRFKSKEDLYLELIKDQTKDFTRLTKSLQSEEPVRALKSYIELNLKYALKKRRLISLLLREHSLPFIRPLRKDFFETQGKLIEGLLVSGIKTGVFKPLNTRHTSSLIFASIRGAILLKLTFGAGDLKVLGDSLFQLIFNGIKK